MFLQAFYTFVEEDLEIYAAMKQMKQNIVTCIILSYAFFRAFAYSQDVVLFC